MANNLLISYDLMRPEQSYTAVIDRVKELGSWAKVNQSVWYVSSTFTAIQARDYIKPSLDSDDQLIVVDSTNNDAAWSGLSDEVATFVLDKWRS